MAKQAYSAIAILVVFLAGFSIYYLPPTLLPTVPKAHAATQSIVLSGCAFLTTVCIHTGWNGTTNSPNPTITVHQGDTVSTSLTSADASTHQFLVDVDRDGIDTTDCPAVDPCSMNFPPSQSYSFNVNFAPGTYTYLCTFHSTIMTGSFVVLASDFSISASPNTLTIAAGNTGSSTITLTSTGFTGTVSLAAAVAPSTSTITSSPTPASVSLTSGGSGSSNLMVSTALTTPPGSYTVTVTGTSGSLSHPVQISLTVTASGAVGGFLVPVDKLALLAPFIGVASVIAGAVTITVVYWKRARDARMDQ